MYFQVNQILVEGGFAPEWIMLKRDITEQQNELRKYLYNKCDKILLIDTERKKKNDASKTWDLGKTHDATQSPEKEWKKYCQSIDNDDEMIKSLNKNIDKFNLIVPMMNSQMFHFNLEKEADKIYSTCVKNFKQDNIKEIIFESHEVPNKNHNDLKVLDNYSKNISEVISTLLIDFLALLKRKREGNTYDSKS